MIKPGSVVFYFAKKFRFKSIILVLYFTSNSFMLKLNYRVIISRFHSLALIGLYLVFVIYERMHFTIVQKLSFKFHAYRMHNETDKKI